MTESKPAQERTRPAVRMTALRILKQSAAQEAKNRTKQTHIAPLPFQSLPPPGKRYMVLSGIIVLFAALMIIISTDIKTVLGVLGVSVLFVIAVSTIVNRLL